jgi:hypothetical protein
MLAMEGGGVEPPLIRRFEASLSRVSYSSSALSFPIMMSVRSLRLEIVSLAITMQEFAQGFLEPASNTPIQYNPYDLGVIILELFVLNGTRVRLRFLKNEGAQAFSSWRCRSSS